VPAGGRIVAVGGHLHGGSQSISLTQSRCGGRTLVTSRPTYGQPDNPVYQVKPLLHEPDPLNLSWWQSASGIPVRKGEVLRVSSRYRNDYPYMRVMGIVHVYIAHGKAPGSDACGALPSDAQTLGANFVGRSAPPHMELTLAEMGGDGYAHPWDGPPPPTRSFAGDANIKESGYRFSPGNLSIPAGRSLVWRFGDKDLHDATLAVGPRGFSSPPMWGGKFKQRFNLPGTYRIYCSLHPIEMQQVVTVRGH
jgi:plastocyanin